MNTLLTSAAVLASDVDLDKNSVTPGVLGFLAVFSIGVALYFLMRSLTGKLRRLDANEAVAEDSDADPEAGADAVAEDRGEESASAEARTRN